MSANAFRTISGMSETLTSIEKRVTLKGHQDYFPIPVLGKHLTYFTEALQVCMQRSSNSSWKMCMMKNLCLIFKTFCMKVNLFFNSIFHELLKYF